MKVEIQKLNNNPANTIMNVYDINGLRPICDMYEEDFIEILSDKQLSAFMNGEFRFNINKDTLFEKSRKWFGVN